MATWPDTLPQSIVVGYQRQPMPGSVLNFETDTGVQSRIRTATLRWMLRCQLEVTGAQLEALQTFYFDNIATSFEWVDFFDGENDDPRVCLYRFSKALFPPVANRTPALLIANRLFIVSLDLEFKGYV